MSNLSITTRCNQNCPYCFAGDSRGAIGSATMMSRETFLRAVEYLRRSKIRQVRLLGGEPTLHPDFAWMTETAIAEGFDLLVFSNGLMSEAIVRHLEEVPDDRLCILLNTLDPVRGITSNVRRQRAVMQRLRKRVMLGVNIYTRGQPLDHLLDNIEAFELKREIRVGLAQPLLTRQNRYLHPKFYLDVGKALVDFHHRAAQRGIRLGADCGFVPCMFPPQAWDSLEDLLERSGRCCHPNLDLLPDGRFISCYPLHDLKQIPLDEATTAEELIRQFEQARSGVRELGVFPFCRDCPLFGQRCNGGCAAMKMRRWTTPPVAEGRPGRGAESTEHHDGEGAPDERRLSA
jgi:radical SAM protein with 4Fe4S-binding SPASM domain